MIWEHKGVCQHCAESYRILLLENTEVPECGACGQAPMTVSKVQGIVYIASNPHQDGVKVGLTTKSLNQRIKQLNGTGVPGKLDPIAIFPSRRPKADEVKVHKKLKKYWISGEHFQVPEVDAVLLAYRALSRRKPIFFDDRLRGEFDLRLDQARAEFQLRLQGKTSA